MTRKRTSQPVMAEVLVQYRRRCALCYGLNFDLGPKDIQLAHLDRDPANNAATNLVPLCLVHHDQYDSRPRQTKGISPTELRIYRDELLDILSEKSRVVRREYVGPDGNSEPGVTDASRLGRIVRLFDDDVARPMQTGVGLLDAVKTFMTADGDFAAVCEATAHLLRLIEHEPTGSRDRSASYLLGRNELPVASPLVALVHALATAAGVDGSTTIGLMHMADDWAFLGPARSFSNMAITDVPQAHAEAHLVALAALTAGRPVPCVRWVRDFALESLVTSTCRITIAYALQGRHIPDTIATRYYDGQGNRTGPPGPSKLGGRTVPDLWYRALWLVGRLPMVSFKRAQGHIPTSLADWEPLFDVSTEQTTLTCDQAKDLADMWTTRWRGVAVGGRVLLGTEAELAAVRAHARARRAQAEAAISRLARCLADEHTLAWMHRGPGDCTASAA